jgi:hypothetical protein
MNYIYKLVYLLAMRINTHPDPDPWDHCMSCSHRHIRHNRWPPVLRNRHNHRTRLVQLLVLLHHRIRRGLHSHHNLL